MNMYPLTFEVFKGKKNLFYFRLKAHNGRTIVQSEGYSRRSNALEVIESIKTKSHKAKIEIVKK